MTLGEKIQRLRKETGLSQEALAEKINVTRQTVSKWECNQSSPDLDFIAQLSDIFNVSADYLIQAEMLEPGEPLYKKRRYRLSEKGKRRVLLLVSAAALLASYICMLCDYLVSGGLSWALIAVASIVAAWCVMLPGLTASKNVVLKTVMIASIVPIPFLAVLSLLLKRSVIFSLGACITLLVAAAIWSIYKIFCKYKENLRRAAGLALLVLIPIPIAITYVSAYFLPKIGFDFTSAVCNSGMLAALSLACFGLEYLHCQKKDVKEGEK